MRYENWSKRSMSIQNVSNLIKKIIWIYYSDKKLKFRDSLRCRKAASPISRSSLANGKGCTPSGSSSLLMRLKGNGHSRDTRCIHWPYTLLEISIGTEIVESAGWALRLKDSSINLRFQVYAKWHGSTREKILTKINFLTRCFYPFNILPIETVRQRVARRFTTKRSLIKK